MNCIVALEERFRLCHGKPGSAVYSYDKFWKRYLEVFDSVTIVSRLEKVEDPSVEPAEGPGVTLLPLPGFRGAAEYLRNRSQVNQLIKSSYQRESAFILRVPGQIGSCLIPVLKSHDHPFALEVLGDPYDVFDAIKHPLRPVFKWWFPRRLKTQCRQASAVSYVTSEALQRRYPCSGYTTAVSSVDLPDTAFVSAPRPLRSGAGPFTLVHVGTMSQLYKAHDVVIDAVAALVRGGLDLRLVFIGDGAHRAELEARARDAQLYDRVTFRGQLPSGDAVRQALDQADLFVLPSRCEGLPRALIEAMARGLPAIGSTIGGFPELLPAEDLVPPGNVEALTTKLREMLTDPARMARASERNLRTSHDYRREILRARRVAFYRHVQELTNQWLNGKA